jgi:hypothetical protein
MAAAPGVRQTGRSVTSDGIRIIVASEPRAYREALAGVLAATRPQDDVVSAAPAELADMGPGLAGALVLCNEITPEIAELAGGWVRLTEGGGVELSPAPDVEAMAQPRPLELLILAVEHVSSALAQVR